MAPADPSLEDHLRKVAFLTLAFLAAWSWVLVYYGLSHALAGETPLENQVGFGGQGRPKSLPLLALQYLAVCGGAAWLAGRVRTRRTGEAAALVAALEFFPSPVFSGKLLSYLGQFSGAGALQHGLLTLAASWAVAAAIYMLPTAGRFHELSTVVRGTVGFGLGVAWNFLVLSSFEPADSRLAARTAYLLTAVLAAARLAAPEPSEDSLTQRHAALVSFASRVVCAFALSDWLAAALPAGAVGSLCSLGALMVLAAALSAALARADLEGQAVRARELAGRKDSGCLRCLVLVPCVWCCCPFVPLLWLLSGDRPGVKNRWLGLVADTTGLAASVVGTNILTGAVDAMAAGLGLCGAPGSACSPFAFVLFEALCAAAASAALLGAAAPLADPPPPDEGREALLQT